MDREVVWHDRRRLRTRPIRHEEQSDGGQHLTNATPVVHFSSTGPAAYGLEEDDEVCDPND